MRIKVHGGTSFGSENLCRTCRHATFIRGSGTSKTVVHCTAIQDYVKFPVMECSDYHNKCHVRLDDMKKIAWVLVPKKGQPAGFVSQADIRRMREEGALKDDRFTSSAYNDPGVDDD